jgi:two-component system NarL family response regulator
LQIRVLIADDHVVFRTGLKDALRLFSDIEIVGEAATARAAVAAARETRPDIVIMDLRMPDGDGIDAIREIRSVATASQVLVLTAYGDLELFHHAVRAGAAGYVLKDISVQNLAGAIRAVHRGDTMINPSIARALLTELAGNRRDTPSKPAGLSDREMEILINVARGFSDKDLAARLFLSESTIKSYLRRIYRKLRLRNRVQAAAYALQHHLLPPNDSTSVQDDVGAVGVSLPPAAARPPRPSRTARTDKRLSVA